MDLIERIQIEVLPSRDKVLKKDFSVNESQALQCQRFFIQPGDTDKIESHLVNLSGEDLEGALIGLLGYAPSRYGRKPRRTESHIAHFYQMYGAYLSSLGSLTPNTVLENRRNLNECLLLKDALVVDAFVTNNRCNGFFIETVYLSTHTFSFPSQACLAIRYNQKAPKPGVSLHTFPFEMKFLPPIKLPLEKPHALRTPINQYGQIEWQAGTGTATFYPDHCYNITMPLNVNNGTLDGFLIHPSMIGTNVINRLRYHLNTLWKVEQD